MDVSEDSELGQSSSSVHSTSIGESTRSPQPMEEETHAKNSNGNVAENAESDDDIIVEEEILFTEEQKNDLKCNRIDEMLSWFLKMKVELYKNFDIDRSDYLDNSTAGLAVDIKICRMMLDEYAKTQSLDGFKEKFNLDCDALVTVSLCMATLDENNSRDIDFTPICAERLDRWAYNHINSFMDQRTAGTDKNTKFGPLELTICCSSPPETIVLGLTILWLQINNFPCRVDWAKSEHCTVRWEELDDICNRVKNVVERVFERNQFYEEESAKLPEDRRDVVEQCVKVTSAFNTDTDRLNRTLAEMANIKKQIRQEPDKTYEPTVDLSCLTDDERKDYEASLLLYKEVEFRAEILKRNAASRMNGGKTLLEALVLWPSEICLARKEPFDSAKFFLAYVEAQINEYVYRVRYVDEDRFMNVHVRDLATPKLCMLDSCIQDTEFIGLRVACLCEKIDTRTMKIEATWLSGTIGGRPSTHGKDFLVFLDNNDDTYITAPYNPMAPEALSGDMLKSNCDDVENVVKRLKLVKMVPLIEQALNTDKSTINKPEVHNLIRDRNKYRKKFLSLFMGSFPEWPLLRFKVGHTVRISDYTKLGNVQINIVGLDRAFFYCRLVEKPNSPGYGCLQHPCTDRRHAHIDEKLYKGSFAFKAVELDRMDDNNLSKRSRNKIRRQFDAAEPVRRMPTMDLHDDDEYMENSDYQRKKRGDGDQITPKMSALEIADRRQKQTIITKTKGYTPVLKPLKDLKYHATCGSECVQEWDKDPYDARFHQCSPLHTPMMCGWRRLKYVALNQKRKQTKSIVYYGPCGKPLPTMASIRTYLRDTRSLLTVDCFNFDLEIDTEVYITSEEKYLKTKDYAEGIEGIPIPAVNTVDDEEPPKIEYSSRRHQYDETVDISTINKTFCSGCTCEGDCSDSSKCECQRLTMESYSRMPPGLLSEFKKFKGLYEYKNLLDKVPGGIYECNDNCACQRKSCSNRVVQEGIKYPMQLFKTAESGWGVRALTDIPRGAFLCNYVGALLSDSLADSMNNEDQYFADLDLKDHVEKQKVQGDEDEDGDGGFEDDDEMSSSGLDDDDSGAEEVKNKSNGAEKEENREFLDEEGSSMDGTIRRSARQLEKLHRKREKREEAKKMKKERKLQKKKEDFFVWERYFTDCSLFVIDAKHRGNIGRFFNHSCEPNLTVQHVLYDTHDLRLPWAAFFTTTLIRAGQEICWDYAYEDTGDSTTDFRISCRCGAKRCRGRLL